MVDHTNTQIHTQKAAVAPSPPTTFQALALKITPVGEVTDSRESSASVNSAQVHPTVTLFSGEGYSSSGDRTAQESLNYRS